MDALISVDIPTFIEPRTTDKLLDESTEQLPTYAHDDANNSTLS